MTPSECTTRTGIYVHLPFCRIRCTYCAFAISTHVEEASRYFDALVREVDDRAAVVDVVESVYFGGGTPSLTPAGDLARTAAALDRRFGRVDGCEFTLEANPEDVTAEAVDRWKSLGVTRLSLGVQSLNDRELAPLGRGHGRRNAIEALEIALESGLRVNADLIVGLPLQTRKSFLESLDRVVEAGVGHLSLYMLDLEEGSVLERRVRQGWKTLPDEELVASAYLDAVDILAARGLNQYEISNFARAGEESEHNLRYWRRGTYVGVGLGAHSFDGQRRYANSRDLEDYMCRVETEGSAMVFDEIMDDEKARREKLLLGLRQVIGLQATDFRDLAGSEGEAWRAQGVAQGWVVDDASRVALTPRGFLMSNELIAELF